MGTPATNLVSLKFGILTVIARSRVNHGKRYACWLCRCDCGEEIIVRGDRLRQGRKKFCSNRRHRLDGSAVADKLTYSSWRSALERTQATDGKAWRNYGSRGITVCERWQKFENFFADMGKRPDALHTLDRIDNDKSYGPENCRWAGKSTQRRNSRDTVWVEYLGERHRLADLCDAHGLDYSQMSGRIRTGWTMESAMTIPKGMHRATYERHNAAVAKRDV